MHVNIGRQTLSCPIYWSEEFYENFEMELEPFTYITYGWVGLGWVRLGWVRSSFVRVFQHFENIVNRTAEWFGKLQSSSILSLSLCA